MGRFQNGEFIVNRNEIMNMEKKATYFDDYFDLFIYALRIKDAELSKHFLKKAETKAIKWNDYLNLGDAIARRLKDIRWAKNVYRKSEKCMKKFFGLKPWRIM